MRANQLQLIVTISLLICFQLLYSAETANENEEKDSEYVINITPKTFYEQFKKYGKLVIYFHSRKCGHCKHFSPLFDEVAKQAHQKNFGFGFVKIDGPDNEEFSDGFKLTETPSVFFVEKVDGQIFKTKYEGKRSIRGMIRYLTKKHSYRPRELTDYKEFRELVKKTKKFMIFFGDKATHQEILNKFINAALDVGFENILWTKSPEFYEKYNVTKDQVEVVIHTNIENVLDDGLRLKLQNYPLKDLKQKLITHLVFVHNIPLAPNFEEDTIKGIELHDHPLTIVLYDKNSKNFGRLYEEIKKVNEKYRVESYFYTSAYGTKEASGFAGQMNIRKSDLPAYVIFSPSEGGDIEEMIKYCKKSIKDDVEEGDFTKWFEDYRSGKLERYVMSESIPQDPVDNNGVYKLVGHTFKDVILNKAAGKHVVLSICSDNVRCQSFESRFARVVKKLRKNENLFFAKIDYSKNEFDYVNTGITPSVALIFDGLNRFENVELYDGQLTSKAIIEYLEKHLKAKKNVLQVEAFPDDKDVDAREKYAPIKPKQEEESDGADEKEESKPVTPDADDEETNDKSTQGEEKVDLDSGDSEHIKEGL